MNTGLSQEEEKGLEQYNLEQATSAGLPSGFQGYYLNNMRLYNEIEMRNCWNAAMEYAINKYEYEHDFAMRITSLNEDEYLESLNKK